MSADKIVKKYFLFVIFCVCVQQVAAYDEPCRVYEYDTSAKSQFKRTWHDFGEFNKKIVSLDTIKIIAAGVPVYVVARILDKSTHKVFYCSAHHCNKRQMPNTLYHGVNVGLGVLMIGMASLSFYKADRHLQRTAQLYALTLPYTWAAKKILKTIKWDGCRRPKNQWFDKHKKYYGGCPSGHMMEIMYTAVLFGTQMGPRFGIPLGIFAGAVALESINCNRHFLSQLVAGAGVGVILGVAANKALALPDTCDLRVQCVPDGAAGLAVRTEYRF